MNGMVATLEQKRELITKALEIIGFEEMPAPGIFAKEHGDNKILVDVNEKQPCAVFRVGTKRFAEDDEYGTLLKIDEIIVKAEDGQMPTKSKPDIVINNSGDCIPPSAARETLADLEAEFYPNTTGASS